MTNQKTTTSLKTRIIHRYLGYFLSGIMIVYALSGIMMIFRNTNFLKREVVLVEQLEPNLKGNELNAKLDMKVKLTGKEGDFIMFKNGNYNQKTGVATVKKMKLPVLIEKMEKLHKSNTKSPLYYLNVFFGISLLFFALSAFWMYKPKVPIFKKGMYFAAAGIILTLTLLFW